MEGVAARPSLPLQLRFPSQRCLFGRVVSAQRRTQKRGARIDIDARAFARRLGPNICHLRYVRHGRSDSLTARMGIKWIESFESQVDLPAEKKAELETLLYNATFCKQVAQETKQEPHVELEYSGMVFQPVPWSPTTTKGMPQEFEKYHNDDNYVTINVPPNFLFQSKVFQPSRLCALYRKKAGE